MAVAAAERSTERTIRWMTVQFVGQAGIGSNLVIDTEVVAHSGAVSQVVVTARDGERVVFSGVGATALDREGVDDIEFLRFPDVPAPEECDALGRSIPEHHPTPNMMKRMEVRLVPQTGVAPMNGEATEPFRLWVRARGTRADAAVLGYLSDWVPAGVWRALRREGTGVSLDATIRYGRRDPTEWILVDIAARFCSGGYTSGEVAMWSSNGRLVAVAGQTATLKPVRPRRAR